MVLAKYRHPIAENYSFLAESIRDAANLLQHGIK
jgi:hypothetical protein